MSQSRQKETTLDYQEAITPAEKDQPAREQDQAAEQEKAAQEQEQLYDEMVMID